MVVFIFVHPQNPKTEGKTRPLLRRRRGNDSINKRGTASEALPPILESNLGITRGLLRLVNLEFRLEVHRFAEENDAKMNRASWHSIIGFYAKCGCLDFAYQVFDEMSDRDGVTNKAMNLSGGQKQKIQLSSAVYNNSDVYLLDYPLSAVDAHTGAYLFKECLMRLLSSRTIIYVTHQLEFLAAADLILVLRDGKMAQSGKNQELMEETDGELVQQMATHNETPRRVLSLRFLIQITFKNANQNSSLSTYQGFLVKAGELIFRMEVQRRYKGNSQQLLCKHCAKPPEFKAVLATHNFEVSYLDIDLDDLLDADDQKIETNEIINLVEIQSPWPDLPSSCFLSLPAAWLDLSSFGGHPLAGGPLLHTFSLEVGRHVMTTPKAGVKSGKVRKAISFSLFPVLSVSFKVGLLVEHLPLSPTTPSRLLRFQSTRLQCRLGAGGHVPRPGRPPSPSAEPPNSSAAFSRFLPTPTTTPLTTSPSGPSTSVVSAATLTSSSVKAWSSPPNPYTCGVCGRKCRTNLDLKKHFRQLHQRERQKKLDRMRSLKGKKRQRYRERYIAGNYKYEEAARSLLAPKTGYSLASELRRAGVFVKTVEDKPQAADWALKRQMQHSMSRGIDWLFLVSDDSDFSDMVRRAREADLRTVVVGDGRTALGCQADILVPWLRVENGEVGEEQLLQSGWNTTFSEMDDYDDFSDNDQGSFSSSSFYEDEMPDLDLIVDEIVIGNSRLGTLGSSAFSEEVVEDGEGFQIFGSPKSNDHLFFHSEEEDSDPFI
ncbi:hypothetical protein ZIOFF_053060 [Zingiber officinale]|uniref:C2H2-type domain-containing protein n=1 Tax=Zingiber officinale TaxID=94328 RepID=A0A8J5FS55_ZINOF|nr:hypothetical protein ZIOFF_053060 [Zingiber officinale]